MSTTTTDTLYRMRGMCAEEQIRRLHAENARIRNMIARGGLSRSKINTLVSLEMRNDKRILEIGGTAAYMQEMEA